MAFQNADPHFAIQRFIKSNHRSRVREPERFEAEGIDF